MSLPFIFHKVFHEFSICTFHPLLNLYEENFSIQFYKLKNVTQPNTQYGEFLSLIKRALVISNHFFEVGITEYFCIVDQNLREITKYYRRHIRDFFQNFHSVLILFYFILCHNFRSLNLLFLKHSIAVVVHIVICFSVNIFRFV